MTLVQMKYFSVVCEVLNFTRAAELLHVSQPAISASIKDMERECGVALFVRDKNALQLTDEGRILYESIQPILRQYDSLNHVVDQLYRGQKFVRVGFATLFGAFLYSDVLPRFRRLQPDIQVTAVEASASSLLERLDNNQVDLILTAAALAQEQAWREGGAYRILPVSPMTVHFCVSREHPLALKDQIVPEDLDGIPLVLLTERVSSSDIILDQIKKRGVEPDVIHYTDQIYTVERFIENNAAAGFLPSVVAARNRYMVGIPYWGTDFKGHLCALWKKERLQTPGEKAFIHVLKEYAKGGAAK